MVLPLKTDALCTVALSGDTGLVGLCGPRVSVLDLGSPQAVRSRRAAL